METYLGDKSLTKHKKSNSHDQYAIAVLPVDDKVTKIVDHLLSEISKNGAYSYFTKI